MNIEQLKVKLLELKVNLENPRTSVKLKEHNYNLDKLNTVIEIYLKNIQNIDSKELLQTIENKINSLLNYTRQSNILDYIHSFENDAGFLISNVPKNTEILEMPDNLEISEEEFKKRFNSWLNLLNLKLEKKSNFIFLDDNITYEFYRTKDDNVLFKEFSNNREELSSEKYINLIELINIVFKGEKGNTKLAEIIALKIKDKSIFDFFVADDSLELLEVLKDKLLKNENDILVLENNLENLQKENKEIEDKKLEFNKIFEKSKTINEEYENTIVAAEKRAELGASVSYWKVKQEKHKKEFWKFTIMAISLIIILVLILMYFLNSHMQKNQITENIRNEIISEIINKIDKKLEKEKTVKSDENNKLNEKKDIKSEPKELKLEKQAKDNKSLGIDINVQIEKVTQTYKEELNADSKEITEKKDENSLLKDFENSNLPWYLLMIFASSSAFWIIRITVKIALSNLHLSEDAHERVVMIQTYLAFVKETEIKKEDKELILSSLFRPSNIGIIQDESSVTVTDIITAFKK